MQGISKTTAQWRQYVEDAERKADTLLGLLTQASLGEFTRGKLEVVPEGFRFELRRNGCRPLVCQLGTDKLGWFKDIDHQFFMVAESVTQPAEPADVPVKRGPGRPRKNPVPVPVPSG